MTDLPLLRPELVDGYIQVEDDEAIHVSRGWLEKKGFSLASLRGQMWQRPCSCCELHLRGKQLSFF